jgi:hypothetical protein
LEKQKNPWQVYQRTGIAARMARIRSCLIVGISISCEEETVEDEKHRAMVALLNASLVEIQFSERQLIYFCRHCACKRRAFVRPNNIMVATVSTMASLEDVVFSSKIKISLGSGF